jgi:hypothetical protein
VSTTGFSTTLSSMIYILNFILPTSRRTYHLVDEIELVYQQTLMNATLKLFHIYHEHYLSILTSPHYFSSSMIQLVLIILCCCDHFCFISLGIALSLSFRHRQPFILKLRIGISIEASASEYDLRQHLKRYFGAALALSASSNDP